MSRDRRPHHGVQHRAVAAAHVRQIPPEIVRPDRNLFPAALHAQPTEDDVQRPQVALRQHADDARQRLAQLRAEELLRHLVMRAYQTSLLRERDVLFVSFDVCGVFC